MLHLPNVTMFAVACTRMHETVHALRQSMKNIQYRETLLLTHEKLSLDHFGIKVIPIERLDYKGYNHFILFRVNDHISTEFSLLVQNDGYVLRPEKWDNRFFSYDYIGAPWAKDVHFTEDGTNVRVGNGGFSFRSKKLLGAFSRLNLPFTDNGTGYFHEDGNICVYYRKQLEAYGIKFAPAEIAAQFSRETVCDDLTENHPFGFHRNKKFMPLALRLKMNVRNIRQHS